MRPPLLPHNREQAIALVTVLSLLSVLTVLTVAILSTSLTEFQSAAGYAASVRARQQSETVVNVVIDQIREATRPGQGTTIFGQAEGSYWSSQPGMIRTYNTEGFGNAFKLYSSADMVVEEQRDLLRESARLSGWEDKPAQFVDLNAPTIGYDVKGLETTRHFPILDPRAHVIDKVEGFGWDDLAMANIASASDLQQGKRLPMPVEWLYLLKDGSLGALDPSGKFQGEAKATKSNPITARMAFWADDESCKININTAAEGVPWDTPRAATEEAREWATKQPVTNEVQRYPGHPATTCLSSVLFPHRYPDGNGQQKLTERHLEAIYELAPKVYHGGTEGGSKAADLNITFDTDRLYASVDEIVFNVRRENNAFVSLVQSDGGDGVARLSRARGFLTTRSQAPEANVHGRPRISLWPMANEDNKRHRTAYDNTMAFCTSLGNGKQRYFYHRTGSHLRHIELYVHGKRVNIVISWGTSIRTFLAMALR